MSNSKIDDFKNELELRLPGKKFKGALAYKKEHFDRCEYRKQGLCTLYISSGVMPVLFLVHTKRAARINFSNSKVKNCQCYFRYFVNLQALKHM